MEQVSVNGIFHNNLFNNPMGFNVGELWSGWLLSKSFLSGAFDRLRCEVASFPPFTYFHEPQNLLGRGPDLKLHDIK